MMARRVYPIMSWDERNSDPACHRRWSREVAELEILVHQRVAREPKRAIWTAAALHYQCSIAKRREHKKWDGGFDGLKSSRSHGS